MKTLLYTFVDVGLLAKLFAKVLLEEAAVVSISEFTTFLCQRIRFIVTATGLISSFEQNVYLRVVKNYLTMTSFCKTV